MFSKLLKYEYRATARVMMPVYGIFLLLVGCTALTRFVTYYLLPDTLLDFVRDLLTVFSFFGFVGVLLVSSLLSVVRFYQMLGDSGYLYFSFPVTPTQHMLARALVGTTWTLGFLLACGLFFFFFSDAPEIIFPECSASPVKWFTLGVILLSVAEVIASIMSGYFAMFLCCAIGAQWTQRRLLATFVAYLVMGAISQALSTLILVFAWLFNAPIIWLQSLFDLSVYNIVSVAGFFQLTIPIWIALFYTIITGAVCFYFTKKLLEKRLNLP